MVAQVRNLKPQIPGVIPDVGQWIGNMLALAATTGAQNQRVMRGVLVQLPAPMRVDRLSVVCITTPGVFTGGTNQFAIRIYPATALNNPLAAANPQYVADETVCSSSAASIVATDLTTTGEKFFHVNWALPQTFWLTFGHNYGTTNPIMSQQAVSTLGKGHVVAPAGSTPGAAASSALSPNWTEATWDAGLARAWGNTAVTWTAVAPLAVSYRAA